MHTTDPHLLHCHSDTGKRIIVAHKVALGQIINTFNFLTLKADKKGLAHKISFYGNNSLKVKENVLEAWTYVTFFKGSKLKSVEICRLVLSKDQLFTFLLKPLLQFLNRITSHEAFFL